MARFFGEGEAGGGKLWGKQVVVGKGALDFRLCTIKVGSTGFDLDPSLAEADTDAEEDGIDWEDDVDDDVVLEKELEHIVLEEPCL